MIRYYVLFVSALAVAFGCESYVFTGSECHRSCHPGDSNCYEECEREYVSVCLGSSCGDDEDDEDYDDDDYDDDRDDDGIADDREGECNTHPGSWDTDGDGISDGEEDPDGDGYSNIEEIEASTDPGDGASFPGDAQDNAGREGDYCRPEEPQEVAPCEEP